MTYAAVSPDALERAIERMAADLGVTPGELLEALTPMVIGWCINRTAADLDITTREARTRVARWIDRTA